ncbi:MAG: ribose-phosphate diphosphokinase [Acidobacteriia bacterium]|nr:ribose-phosphate diphosphokinase [Terriglobia bacterium]
MILFAVEQYAGMALELEKAIGQLQPGTFRIARFENGELHARVDTSITAQHCAVLGSIAPPDEQLLSVLLLAHTLKKEGARQVTAVLPYLGYARDDKDKPGQSLATAWAGSLIQASGCDRVITVDVHSERTKTLFPVPLVSLSPAGVFAEAINRYGLADATVVAPDEGAISRCEAVRAAAGMRFSKIPYFEKHRTETGIIHSGPIGEVRHRAVIIDDILDTGGTLVSACEKLSKAGVEEIDVMVTHGLFTGTRWKDLYRLGVKRIFCTDSVPLPAGVDRQSIVSLSIVRLLAKELLAIAET